MDQKVLSYPGRIFPSYPPPSPPLPPQHCFLLHKHIFFLFQCSIPASHFSILLIFGLARKAWAVQMHCLPASEGDYHETTISNQTSSSGVTNAAIFLVFLRAFWYQRRQWVWPIVPYPPEKVSPPELPFETLHHLWKFWLYKNHCVIDGQTKNEKP